MQKTTTTILNQRDRPRRRFGFVISTQYLQISWRLIVKFSTSAHSKTIQNESALIQLGDSLRDGKAEWNRLKRGDRMVQAMEGRSNE